MGTNYYLYDKPKCESCGRSYEPLHIGKSSGGWCFSLHVIPEKSLNDLEDWEVLWNKPNAIIADEYERQITPDAMIKIIKNRGTEKRSTSAFDYKSNQAMEGPNNLVRSVIDGKFCVGHGKGTWDLKSGEFC